MQKKGKRKKEKRKKNRIILRGCSRAAIDRSYGGRINFPYIEPLHSTSTGKTGGGGGEGLFHLSRYIHPATFDVNHTLITPGKHQLELD